MSDSAEPKEIEKRMNENHLEISDMSQENFIWYVAIQISSRFMDVKDIESYDLVRLIYDTLVSENINNDKILKDFYIPNNKDIQEIQGIQKSYEVTYKYQGNLHNRICEPRPEDKLTMEERAEFLVQKPIFSSRLLTRPPFSSPVPQPQPQRTDSAISSAGTEIDFTRGRGGYSGINKKKNKSRKNKKTRRKTRRKPKKIRTRKNKQVRRKH